MTYSAAMSGTSAVHILEMLFTPPMMEHPTVTERMKPTNILVRMGLMKSLHTIERFSLMALACTVLPMPNVAMTAKAQKTMPSQRWPIPFSKAIIGPPIMRPSGVFLRYLMASSPSLYLVAMPKTPVIQHHNTAPGPPRLTAVATPMMLPVPIVAASDVARAANWLTSPDESLSLLKDMRMAVNILR